MVERVFYARPFYYETIAILFGKIKAIRHKIYLLIAHKYPSKSFAAFRRGNALCLPRFGQGQALPLRKSLNRYNAAEFLLTYLHGAHL